MADFNKIYLFRITHIQNIPHILKFGITHRNSPNANSEYVDIGDGSLISTRNSKSIYVNNGEKFSSNHKSINLGTFVPFYFGKRMPLLYVIQKGFNNVKKQQPTDIVYCVCILQRIIDANLEFYITDGHATDNLSSCYEKGMVLQLNKIVDFEATKVFDWTKERDLKRRMEAECLIRGDVPAHCIAGFVCFNEDAKEQLVHMNIDENAIQVRPNYYF